MAELWSGGGPTVRRLLLGARLRRLRTEAGISREEAGEAIRASAWKIHRLENGQVGVKQRDVVDLLRLYGVSDLDEVAAFVTMAQAANEPGWWSPYADVLPQWFRAYLDLEAAATLIRTYEGLLVPGLLQTEAYMHAVMEAGQVGDAPEELKRRVELRLGRQELLTRPDPPRLWVVVDEAALRRPVGGRQVLREQLERLVEAADLPGVTLQVLPLASGAHPGLVGAFSILRFADAELPDVVYLEHQTGAVYLDKPGDVDQYAHVMNSIAVASAPADQTPAILAGLLRDLG
jgi:transcriptional regulator with XRE-family HTH domain